MVDNVLVVNNSPRAGGQCQPLLPWNMSHIRVCCERDIRVWRGPSGMSADGRLAPFLSSAAPVAAAAAADDDDAADSAVVVSQPLMWPAVAAAAAEVDSAESSL